MNQITDRRYADRFYGCKPWTPVSVVISERLGSPMRYHVCVEGSPEKWEQGHSESEACERLIATHPITCVGGIGQRRHRGLVTQDLQDYVQTPESVNAGIVAAAINAKHVLKMVLQHGRIDDSESRMSAVASAITDLEANGG